MSIFNISLIILILISYLAIEIKYGVKSYKGFKKWRDKRFLVTLMAFSGMFVITVILIGVEVSKLF